MSIRTRLAALALLVLPLLRMQEPEAAAAPKTVFLLRHAEAAQLSAEDGEKKLTEVGRRRAADLARLLAPAGVTHLISSPYARTRDTLAPLAGAAGIEVSVLAPDDLEAYRELVAAADPGSVVVVCGHSNTVPALVEALGGDAERFAFDERYGARLIEHERHDRLIELVIPADSEQPVRTLELHLGE